MDMMVPHYQLIFWQIHATDNQETGHLKWGADVSILSSKHNSTIINLLFRKICSCTLVLYDAHIGRLSVDMLMNAVYLFILFTRPREHHVIVLHHATKWNMPLEFNAL